MTEMPDEAKELMDHAAYLRGRYLTSYAQCEFLLADISLKVAKRFRYPVPQRVNAVKELAEGDGPLTRYADELLPLVEGITAWTERRHLLVHGFLTLTKVRSNGQYVFEYQYYEPSKGGELQHKHYIVTIGDLQNDVDSINRYCVAFVTLHKRIYRELDIR